LVDLLELIVFLYDTLLMVAEATETCRWEIIYDKTHFVVLYFLVCYRVWNYLNL